MPVQSSRDIENDFVAESLRNVDGDGQPKPKTHVSGEHGSVANRYRDDLQRAYEHQKAIESTRQMQQTSPYQKRLAIAEAELLRLLGRSGSTDRRSRQSHGKRTHPSRKNRSGNQSTKHEPAEKTTFSCTVEVPASFTQKQAWIAFMLKVTSEKFKIPAATAESSFKAHFSELYEILEKQYLDFRTEIEYVREYGQQIKDLRGVRHKLESFLRDAKSGDFALKRLKSLFDEVIDTLSVKILMEPGCSHWEEERDNYQAVFKLADRLLRVPSDTNLEQNDDLNEFVDSSKHTLREIRERFSEVLI